MASKTFDNLKKEKKERIINAAIKEFSRVPIDKALISNIIKEAGIPRGSFYQYFENIDDLFVYIVDEIYKKFRGELKEEMNEGKTYFEALKNKFYEILGYFETAGNKQFNINIYMSLVDLHSKKSSFLDELKNLKAKDGVFQDMPHSNVVLGLIEMANYTCLNDFVFKEMPKEIVYENYCSYLDFIKKIIDNNEKC